MPGAVVPEWEAERSVDEAQAAALVGAQFPRLRDAAVSFVAAGWDNTVFLVDGCWVFRFPRRQVAVPGVLREISLLPVLAPALPLPVPVPELVGIPTDAFPWPFWGARHLPGMELADAGMPEDRRVRSAARVGHFLSRLHAIPVDEPLRVTLLRDPMQRASPKAKVPRMRQMVARLRRRGLWSGSPRMEQLLCDAELLDAPDGDIVVSHGDLHVRHLLVDGADDAVGVIDWGDLCLADPAVDVSLAFGAFSGAAREALLAEYGAIDAEREVRARALAVFLCAALAEYADSTSRPGLLHEALRGLDRAASA